MRRYDRRWIDDVNGDMVRMIDDMGIFRTSVRIAPWTDPRAGVMLHDVMVDTVSEYNWFPRPLLQQLGIAPQRWVRFETADGRILEREIGYAIIAAGGSESPTIVVFGDPGDMTLLGAFGLEGLNVRIDVVTKELVPAGPVPVAAAA